MKALNPFCKTYVAALLLACSGAFSFLPAEMSAQTGSQNQTVLVDRVLKNP